MAGKASLLVHFASGSPLVYLGVNPKQSEGPQPKVILFEKLNTKGLFRSEESGPYGQEDCLKDRLP